MGYFRDEASLNSEKIASLGRLVSESTDWCAEFFKILRNPHEFKWTEECQKAFEELEMFLSSRPILTPPVSREDLYLYLAVSGNSISSKLA